MVSEKSIANLKPAKKGEVRNPAGRPKGKTLKEFAREWLFLLTEEEKQKFLKKLSPDIVWRMAEGNPHNTEDITSKGEKITASDLMAKMGMEKSENKD